MNVGRAAENRNEKFTISGSNTWLYPEKLNKRLSSFKRFWWLRAFYTWHSRCYIKDSSFFLSFVLLFFFVYFFLSLFHFLKNKLYQYCTYKMSRLWIRSILMLGVKDSRPRITRQNQQKFIINCCEVTFFSLINNLRRNPCALTCFILHSCIPRFNFLASNISLAFIVKRIGRTN